MARVSLSRRSFLLSAGALLAGRLLDRVANDGHDYTEVDAFIRGELGSGYTPGIAVCVVRGERIDWAAGYGWSDIANGTRMSPETIQNIASISKTITATAVMQLWEEGRFRLDDDVSDYLPFVVRNPHFPETPITVRQLLTHRSSITDSPAYDASYACGDPAMSLMDWLRAYFDPAGSFYDATGNFLAWKPGTPDPPKQPRPYSNLAFGLLGGLVETVARVPFEEHVRQKIFEPLAMTDSGWRIAEIDRRRHAVPYGKAPDPGLAPPEGPGVDPSTGAVYHPHCLYSFTNFPDGLLRTSALDLSKFLRAYIGRGEFNRARVLEDATVEKMLTASHDEQGLCWSRTRFGSDEIWGHGGSDPGVRTVMQFSPRHRVGVIVFSNYDGWNLVREIADRSFASSKKQPRPEGV